MLVCMQVDGNRKQSTVQPIQHIPHTLTLGAPLTQTAKSSKQRNAALPAPRKRTSPTSRKAGAVLSSRYRNAHPSPRGNAVR